jgi:hypothetical protein
LANIDKTRAVQDEVHNFATLYVLVPDLLLGFRFVNLFPTSDLQYSQVGRVKGVMQDNIQRQMSNMESAGVRTRRIDLLHFHPIEKII